MDPNASSPITQPTQAEKLCPKTAECKGKLTGFGTHIEGVSVDPRGEYLYATHFRGGSKDNKIGKNVIGRISMSDVKDGKLDTGKAWFTGTKTDSFFNGMKWSDDGQYVFLADVGRGVVVRVDVQAAQPQSGMLE